MCCVWGIPLFAHAAFFFCEIWIDRRCESAIVCNKLDKSWNCCYRQSCGKLLKGILFIENFPPPPILINNILISHHRCYHLLWNCSRSFVEFEMISNETGNHQLLLNYKWTDGVCWGSHIFNTSTSRMHVWILYWNSRNSSFSARHSWNKKKTKTWDFPK